VYSTRFWFGRKAEYKRGQTLEIKDEKDKQQSHICIYFHPLELKISRTQFIIHVDGQNPGIQCISSESPTLLKLMMGKPIPLNSRMVIKIGDDQLIGVSSLLQKPDAEGTLIGKRHKHVEKEDEKTIKGKLKSGSGLREKKAEEKMPPLKNSEYVLELVYLDDSGDSRIMNKDANGKIQDTFSYKSAQEINIGALAKDIQIRPNKKNDIKPLHCSINFDYTKSQWYLYPQDESASVFVFIKDYDQFFENNFSNVIPLEKGDAIHIEGNTFLVE
jgi:hypothetical protein